MPANDSEQSAQTPLLSREDDGDRASTLGPASSSASLMMDAATRRAASRQRDVARYVSFASAMLSCLCAGSITAYSLYGHLFQERLGYTQLQVNAVAIAAELGLYLLVPLLGYLCDRFGPAPLSLVAAALFGTGYVLAAFAYRSNDSERRGGEGEAAAGKRDGLPFAVMVLAFVFIGIGTVNMYMSSLTACAKNFGRGRFRGLALASPIAAFGLSGVWQSQVASRVIYETRPDGKRGDIDVFRFFIFLAIILVVVGVLGTFALQIVDEEDMIDDAVEDMERSGLLDASEFFQRTAAERGYGAVQRSRLTDDETDSIRRAADVARAKAEEEARKKTWLLNAETSRFLKDHTMWWLTAGFFLITGPAEAFINNLGTIIGTLYPPLTDPSSIPTSAATHVSLFAITSTAARILMGTLTDLLAPAPSVPRHRTSASNSIASLPPRPSRFAVSRITFLLTFAILLSVGFVILASGAVQQHAERFWVVSALVGASYGAVFSLTPIVVTVIWGVENFGTNWGLVAMVPAIGATVWGVVYSTIYQWAAGQSSLGGGNGEEGSLADDLRCYGKACYAGSFWAMAVSAWIASGLWLWAWKGPHGWSKRGVAV